VAFKEGHKGIAIEHGKFGTFVKINFVEKRKQ
jgi:hypothetical protein